MPQLAEKYATITSKSAGWLSKAMMIIIGLVSINHKFRRLFPIILARREMKKRVYERGNECAGEREREREKAYQSFSIVDMTAAQ